MSGLSSRLLQSAELRQEMKVNPRLYQAMELLHMPLLDLQQHLKQELAENPFLEMDEAELGQEVELDEEQGEEPNDEIDWEEILLDGFSTGSGIREQREDWEPYRAPAVTPPDLHDHLTEQLHHLDLFEREMRLGEEFVGNIGDDGFLVCEVEEVTAGANEWLDDLREVAEERARSLEDPEERERELQEIRILFRPYSVEEGKAILERIQEMDPPGVGARNVRESLLIQLRRLGEEESTAHRIVQDHFEELLNHRWSEVGRALGIRPTEVQAAADEIAKLDPKPGLQLSPERDGYVIPDLIVDKVDGEYVVFLNDSTLPRLRLSRAYREVARDKNKFQGENKEFIANKLSSANWMIQAIEQRRQTMLKVMNFIVDRQREFLEKGVHYLRPLTLREVADHIDMHESTVSRVTNEKFVQTPRGVYPLKYFFSSGISTSTGQDISARGVKAKIKALVEDEDPKKPLTDQSIVDLLKGEGVEIARRTVAKYRDQLGVLPARMRKRV